ncbi:nuclear transport factor 2 family protein [Saccharothrix longispora]|uniref:nuclear transport factor 2 family protein n=1 Tax=Saccharothrix longispora TaxID=33920 RepID=UPI0028FDAAF2|nr:nuclear transport factor 2 family protein [Saccharothrix longispora]MDU0294818.1 nuclear transport factor 2 family protein [Saccharothrix longispora]
MTAAMTREAALVHDFYRFVDSDDVPALVAMFTEDTTYHRPGYPPVVGQDGMSHFYTHQRVIKAGEHRVESVVLEGDQVAVRGSFEGVLRDGTRTSLRYADFFTLAADGRFSKRETFFFAPLV